MWCGLRVMWRGTACVDWSWTLEAVSGVWLQLDKVCTWEECGEIVRNSFTVGGLDFVT